MPNRHLILELSSPSDHWRRSCGRRDLRRYKGPLRPVSLHADRWPHRRPTAGRAVGCHVQDHGRRERPSHRHVQHPWGGEIRRESGVPIDDQREHTIERLPL